MPVLEESSSCGFRSWPDSSSSHFSPGLINKILEGIRLQNTGFGQFVSLHEEDEQAADEETDALEDGVAAVQARLEPLSAEEKRKVTSVHVNMGHLPREQMLALLKAAGAKPKVLQFVKEHFTCNQCMRQQHPMSRRRAPFPRTFTFNRIVALDYFYVSWSGKTLAFLNVICRGSNL